MKVAISGKGGVGKSTVAGTLARLLARTAGACWPSTRTPMPISPPPWVCPPNCAGASRPSPPNGASSRSAPAPRCGSSGRCSALNPDVAGIAEQYAVR